MGRHLLLWVTVLTPLLAQQQEIGLTLGRLAGTERDLVKLKGGTALQANYGYRLMGRKRFALFGEVHLLASPQRVTDTVAAQATRDVASLYVTPGVRLKFFPEGRVQPYVTAGGGYALYEHSVLNVGGRPNQAPRTKGGGALAFGGGVDVPLWRWLGARFEARDFVTGNPDYSLPVRGKRQHNLVAGGGFVLRFGK